MGDIPPERNEHETLENEPRGLREELPKRVPGGSPEPRPEPHARRVAALKMPCTRPLKGYRAPGGKISLSVRGGFYDQHLELRCGQCLDCRINAGEDWATRCTHEASLHERNSFLTLTYDDEHLPADRSLDVEHWQKFAKRLRKRIGPFRFFHVGEYGEENLRPHYHALVFGHDFAEGQQMRPNEGGFKYWTNPILESAWPLGHHLVGHLTPETVGYVCRYTLKKILGTSTEAKERRQREYERVDLATGETWTVKPPYATMSRGGREKKDGGIGARWIERFKSDVFPDDHVVIQGRKHRVPRFYTNKLEQLDPGMAERVKVRRGKSAARRADDNTPERRQVREECTKAKTKLRNKRQLD